ncbi:isoprenylcysteine carboxylmethyltransferase family protein [Candidatus Cyanaurora vandensis]|uniref:methyltransferase family protein n=1 Tax=Candidatus Cyanaurora vandensis TaxID=2714958 RepID=UPI00257B6FE3|nr:isoprenylcysteine carboxylmethyltransferase family protein [Candidatus Cyanaurora vandensis]
MDNPGVIASPPLLYAGVLSVGLLLHRWLAVPVLPIRLAQGLGALSLGLGLAVGIWAVMAMKQAQTNVSPYAPTTVLLVDGPFQISRNPIYLAFTLLYVGVSLWVNALAPLLLLPLVVTVMQWGVIEREEQYLKQKFGETYTRYQGRVRRWL